MTHFRKFLMMVCMFYALNSFGQVTQNQNIYTFKQGWNTKENYIYTGKISSEHVKENKILPFFTMNLKYKIHPLSYKNNILTAKLENLITKKQKNVTLDTSKGVLSSPETPFILTRFNGIWPNKPVKIGDKWVQSAQNKGKFIHFFEGQSTTWTYLFKGIEPIQKVPCAKIEIKISTVSDTKSQGSGVAWINLKDGLINQLDLNFTHTLPKPTSNGVTKNLMKITVQKTK